MPQFLRMPAIFWLLLLPNFANVALYSYLAWSRSSLSHAVLASALFVGVIVIYVFGRKTQKLNDDEKRWNLHDFSRRGMS